MKQSVKSVKDKGMDLEERIDEKIKEREEDMRELNIAMNKNGDQIVVIQKEQDEMKTQLESTSHEIEKHTEMFDEQGTTIKLLKKNDAKLQKNVNELNKHYKELNELIDNMKEVYETEKEMLREEMLCDLTKRLKEK